ncbi:MAG: YihY/virulence factor BrkB family protein [Steroidobacteraceae bacterium]
MAPVPPETHDQPPNLRNAHERGRNAVAPEQIPARGWWDICMRVWQDLSRDNVSLVAGGLAMYSLLSVFPALAAAVSFYGILFSPKDVIQQMSGFAGVLPPGVWDIFNTDLQAVTNHATGALTLAALVAITVALISARSGMSSLMQATNIAYQEREKRSLLRQVLTSMAFTLGAILAFILMLLLGVAVPLVFAAFTSSPWAQRAVEVLRWVLLWLFAVVGLAATYRFAPARERARWRWVTWGSAVAATLWLAGSVLFSLYVRTIGSYAKTYGALGGVIVLLMWFYLSSFFLVLGAEINAEMERQTRRDTTDGPEKPLGERGAYAADTVGPTAAEMKRANGGLVPDRRKMGASPLTQGGPLAHS